MPESAEGKLDQRSWISIGLAIVLVVGAWQLGVKLTRIENMGQQNADAIRRVEVTVTEAVGNRWTSDDQRHWTELLQARNPELDVPPAMRVDAPGY